MTDKELYAIGLIVSGAAFVFALVLVGMSLKNSFVVYFGLASFACAWVSNAAGSQDAPLLSWWAGVLSILCAALAFGAVLNALWVS